MFWRGVGLLIQRIFWMPIRNVLHYPNTSDGCYVDSSVSVEYGEQGPLNTMSHVLLLCFPMLVFSPLQS